jgi:hypothetical protein
LEWYLWFDGREAYRLFDTGPSDLVPAPGYFGKSIRPTIYPSVTRNRFKVRLVAIERDGWPDKDDLAKDEFIIDLDKDPPPSTWTIVTKPVDKTDLQVRVSFDIPYLDYVDDPDLSSPEPQGVQDHSNYPYPWGEQLSVFQHWLGLGQRAVLSLRPERRVSERRYYSLSGPGRLRRYVETVYRFPTSDIGIANDTMSSLYVPRIGAGNYTVSLFEHDFADARFAGGKKVVFRSPGLYNLRDFGLDDRVSAVEVAHTRPDGLAPRPPR